MYSVAESADRTGPLPCLLPGRGGLGRRSPFRNTQIPRLAAGLDAVCCSARGLSFPFPGWLWHLAGVAQVAGRSTGQNPHASLDMSPTIFHGSAWSTCDTYIRSDIIMK